MSEKSRYFGEGRMRALDSLVSWEDLPLNPIWPSQERPKDPKAYIIRQVIENHMKPAHQEVLTGFFFEGKTVTDLAEQRKVTRRAVRAMIERAKQSLKKQLIAHARDIEVPDEET